MRRSEPHAGLEGSPRLPKGPARGSRPHYFSHAHPSRGKRVWVCSISQVNCGPGSSTVITEGGEVAVQWLLTKKRTLY